MVVIFALMAIAVYKIKDEGADARNKNEAFNARTVALMAERNRQEKETQQTLVCVARGLEPMPKIAEILESISTSLAEISRLYHNR